MNSRSQTSARTLRVPKKKGTGRVAHLNILHLKMPLGAFLKKPDSKPIVAKKASRLVISDISETVVEPMYVLSATPSLGMKFDSNTSMSEVLQQRW